MQRVRVGGLPSLITKIQKLMSSILMTIILLLLWTLDYFMTWVLKENEVEKKIFLMNIL
jgi:hypothetical protein